MAEMESDYKEPLILNESSLYRIHKLMNEFNNEYSILEGMQRLTSKDVEKINNLNKEIEELIKHERSETYDEKILDKFREMHIQLYNKTGMINTRVSQNSKKNLKHFKTNGDIKKKLLPNKKKSFTLGQDLEKEKEITKVFPSLEDSDVECVHQLPQPQTANLNMEHSTLLPVANSDNNNNFSINWRSTHFILILMSLIIGLVFYIIYL